MLISSALLLLFFFSFVPGNAMICHAVFLALIIKCQIGSRYRNTAAAIDTSGADTDASGTAPAIDHGISGAVTMTEFSISMANFWESGSKSLQI